MGRSYYTLSLDYQYGIPRDHPTKLERYREISMALRKDDTHKSRSVTCPCGLHSVISRLLAGGSLGFRIAFVASWLTDYCMAVLWCCCSAFVFHCHTNPWGDPMLSSLLVRFRCLWTDQLITGRAGFWCVFWVFLFVLVRFVFLLFSFGTVTVQWIMYRSYSVLFCMLIVVMTDVATALIRWICKMQLSFRLDKRPGESHLALDGKKRTTAISIFQLSW